MLELGAKFESYYCEETSLCGNTIPSAGTVELGLNKHSSAEFEVNIIVHSFKVREHFLEEMFHWFLFLIFVFFK